MWFKRVSAATLSIGFLLLSRWTMRIGRPVDDWYMLVSAWEHVRGWFRNQWSIFWCRYGPVTRDMRSKWVALRASYRSGKYGIQGT